MKLLKLVTLLLPFCSASYEDIAGFQPSSSVTDINAIDLDQASFEQQLAIGTHESYQVARSIYNEGGHSKSYATITLASPLQMNVPKETRVIGTSTYGNAVFAQTYREAEAGSTTLKISYPTSDIQEMHVGCQVGALPPYERVTDGCLLQSGSIEIDGDTYDYNYSLDTDNKNGRTISGFSTSAQVKMLLCQNCPFDEFFKYYSYYGKADYAHTWVEAALTSGETDFERRGNADFSNYGFTGRAESAKKGSVYMNIYMYVIGELEFAKQNCTIGCLDCNYSSLHSLDNSVALYTGSLVGQEGFGQGKLLYTLANKRCHNFRTCRNDDLNNSEVNHGIFELFNEAKFLLSKGQCSDIREIIKKITALMSVPLIQGTLRHAYMVDKLQGLEKAKSEGAVFTASVIPRLWYCDEDDAQILYNNMKVGAEKTDFSAVKEAFERNYACMGISGKLVGGLWDYSTSSYYPGAEPLVDPSSHDSPLSFKVTKNNGQIKMRDCLWVKRRDTINRCLLDGVASMCPHTCDTGVCVDSEARFKVVWNGRKKSRDCIWVANKQTVQRCRDIPGMMDTCRMTCNNC